jgi:hypothetical protein
VQTLLDDYRVDPNLTKNVSFFERLFFAVSLRLSAFPLSQTWSSPLQFAVDIGRISVVQVFTACPRLLINHQTRVRLKLS